MNRGRNATTFESDHRGRTALKHHCHGTPYVSIVVAGEYVEVRDAVPMRCSIGSVVVHAAGEEHADRFAGDTRCVNVELPNWSAASQVDVRDRGAVHRAAATVVAAFYRSPRALPEAIQALQNALQPSEVAEADRPLWLQRVLAEFPWTEAVSLRRAAEIAGLHATHFSRAFRRHMGVTASEYRARARVHLASKLMLETNSSLSRVALHAGLADQSHLTRLFSDRIGLAPAAYRRTFAR